MNLKETFANMKAGQPRVCTLLFFYYLFNQFVLAPFLRGLASPLIVRCGMQLNSATSLIFALRVHPVSLCGLFLLFVLFLIVINWQICSLFNLASTGKIAIRRPLASLNPLSLLVCWLFGLDFSLSLAAVFRLPLFVEYPLGNFIFEHLTRSVPGTAALAAGIALLLVLSYQLIWFYPELTAGTGAWTSIVRTWRRPKAKSWSRILQLLLVALALNLAAKSLALLLPGSVLGLTLYQVLAALLLFACLATIICSVSAPASLRPHRTWLLPVYGVLLLLIGLSGFSEARTYVHLSSLSRPKIIAHRGVSGGNGVSGTIPALQKTSRLRPDYAEMDVHETKDRRFVVLHDENLRKISGLKSAPHDLPLRRLERVVAQENGQRAKLVSFSRYLREASKLKQPLLVEIKSTPRDSNHMAINFMNRYGVKLKKDHGMVQSLNYELVSRLHRLGLKLPLLQLESFNLANPLANYCGYALEYSSLTPDLVRQLHQNGRQVFAWTVNNPHALQHVFYLGVDGVITDNVQLTRSEYRLYLQGRGAFEQKLNYLFLAAA